MEDTSTEINGYETLVETILAARNVSPDDEVYKQLRSNLVSQLEDCVNAAILNNIPEQELQEFRRILDVNSTEELLAFYARVIPNFQTIVVGEMLAFKNRFVA